MANHERHGRHLDPRHGLQRNGLTLASLHINAFESVEAALRVQGGFENHVVLIAIRVNRGNRALRKSVVQRRIDVLDRNSEFRRLYSVDRDGRLRAARLAVAVDVGNAGDLLHAALQLRKPVRNLFQIGPPKRHLILRAGLTAAELYFLPRKHGDIDALDLGKLLSKPPDHR